MTANRKIIPIASQESANAGMSDCAGAEPFALMVLGDSMMPEFEEGEIIIIEPEGLATEGSFVLAFHHDEYIFRQLAKRDNCWVLQPLNAQYEESVIPDLSVVKGVIIQKKRPGSRRMHKNYVTRQGQA